MRTHWWVAAIAAAILSARPTGACLWDRDTLDHEAKGIPDVVQMITGRFERNPPLFYQMRLERAQKELMANPARLDLYDDAAVACDRLGRDDEAIAWMEKKRRILAPGAPAAAKDARYKYHANLGTFFAHKWFRDGARQDRRALLDRAIAELESALAINPEAHFGREKYQLQIIRTLAGKLKPREHEDESLGSVLLEQIRETDGASRMTGDSRDKLVKGLCGLIVLGNAWESPDVFEALSRALRSQRLGVVALMAALRAEELLKGGHKPQVSPNLLRLLPQVKRNAMVTEANMEIVEAQFTRLRDEADRFQANRRNYMGPLLRQGRHPDTDPQFWSGWHPPAPPTLAPTLMERIHLWAYGPEGAMEVFGGALLVLAGVLAVAGRWMRRRRMRTQAACATAGKTGPA